MQINNEFDTSKYEPEVTARLSKDPSEANGKKLTRCEYRYVDKNGDFFSAVANINNGLVSMIVSEQVSPQAQPKVYPKGHAVIKADRIDEILHKLDTYGHVKGPLNWAAAPERDNWKDDTSTTWIIANYEDVQYIISSRQQLPPERYRGFDALYTYLTSGVPGLNREMHQNIGDPAPVETKLVHGKNVKLVPGKRNLLDYGDKKWWIEEEFVGHFELQKDLINDDGSAEIPSSAAFDIKEDGSFSFTMDGLNYKGSLGSERKYNVMASASFVADCSEKDRENAVKKGAIVRSGGSLNLDYYIDDQAVINDESDLYKHIIVNIEGEPYVAGRGAIEPVRMILVRK